MQAGQRSTRTEWHLANWDGTADSVTHTVLEKNYASSDTWQVTCDVELDLANRDPDAVGSQIALRRPDTFLSESPGDTTKAYAAEGHCWVILFADGPLHSAIPQGPAKASATDDEFVSITGV